MLRLLERLPDFQQVADRVAELVTLSESISRQLRAWADSLQNSAIKGQRHLNDRTRAAYQQEQRAQTFIETIREQHEARFGPQRKHD